MRVLDFGCGPGYFTIPIAEMVGSSGHVIAADLQDGMLQKLREKIEGKELANRIILHKCEHDKIGVSENIDFILAFYVIHEVPDKERLFTEFAAILNPGGKLFIVEPPFHVSKKALAETIHKAEAAGFEEIERPRLYFNKTVVLKNKNAIVS